MFKNKIFLMLCFIVLSLTLVSCNGSKELKLNDDSYLAKLKLQKIYISDWTDNLEVRLEDRIFYIDNVKIGEYYLVEKNTQDLLSDEESFSRENEIVKDILALDFYYQIDALNYNVKEVYIFDSNDNIYMGFANEGEIFRIYSIYHNYGIIFIKNIDY